MMKIRIALFLILSAALLVSACGDATAEASKKAADSTAAAIKADSTRKADSTAAATQEASLRQAQLDSTHQALNGKWWHNRAEDGKGTVTYRKDGYNLPPARGREFFVFGSDGSWSWHPIAPTDGNSEFNGKWNSTEKGKYDFSYEKICKNCPTNLEVIELSGDKLVAKFTTPQ